MLQNQVPENSKGNIASTADNIIPTFDGQLATRKFATTLTGAEGQTYISHFVCESSNCYGFEKTMELLGFHPKLGALTTIVSDQRCDKKASAKKTQALSGVKTRTPDCFAGYQTVLRILHDLYSENSADGWLYFSRDRFQIPARYLKSKGKKSVGWTNLFSMETLREGTGWATLSSGAHTIEHDMLLDPDGAVVWEYTDIGFTIPSSSGGKPVIPKSGQPLPTDRLRDTTTVLSTDEPSKMLVTGDNSDKREGCENEREDAYNKFKAAEIEKNLNNGGEWIIAISNLFKEVSFGGVKINPASIEGTVDRNIEQQAIVHGQKAFDDCMNGEPDIDNSDVVWWPPLHLLLDDGTKDEPVELPEITVGGGTGKRCESGSYERQTKIDGQICTETVVVTCEESGGDCDCEEFVEVIVCAD